MVRLIVSLSWRGQVDCPLPLPGGIGYLSLASGWVRLIPHPPSPTGKVCADCHSSRSVRLIVPRRELILPTVPSVPLIWMCEQYTFLNFILGFNILHVYIYSNVPALGLEPVGSYLVHCSIGGLSQSPLRMLSEVTVPLKGDVVMKSVKVEKKLLPHAFNILQGARQRFDHCHVKQKLSRMLGFQSRTT